MPAVYMCTNRSANLTRWCNFISGRRWSQAEFLSSRPHCCCRGLNAAPGGGYRLVSQSANNAYITSCGDEIPPSDGDKCQSCPSRRCAAGLISRIKQYSASVLRPWRLCLYHHTSPQHPAEPAVTQPVLACMIRTRDAVRVLTLHLVILPFLCPRGIR